MLSMRSMFFCFARLATMRWNQCCQEHLLKSPMGTADFRHGFALTLVIARKVDKLSASNIQQTLLSQISVTCFLF